MVDVARALARGDGQSLGHGKDFGFGSECGERSLGLLCGEDVEGQGQKLRGL